MRLMTRRRVPLLLLVLLGAGLLVARQPTPQGRHWELTDGSLRAEFVSHSTLDAWLARDEPTFQPVRQEWPTDLGGSLSNAGGGVFRVTELTINGRGPAFSYRDLYEQAGLTKEMGTLETLMRLHRFVISRRFHGRPYPALNNYPLSYLNFTGAGFCSEDMEAFRRLVEPLGIMSRRVDLGGHVVGEYEVSGSSIIIDGDLEVVYPTRGGERLASLEDIYADRDLAFRVHPYGPWALDDRPNRPLARRQMVPALYGREKVADFDLMGVKHDRFDLILRPGETFRWGFESSPIGHAGDLGTHEKFIGHNRPSVSLESAQYFTVGSFEWQCDFASGAEEDLRIGARELSLSPVAGMGLGLADGETTGSLRWRHEVHYPAYAGVVEADVALPPGTSLTIRVRYGENEHLALFKQGPHNGAVRAELPKVWGLFKSPWSHPETELLLESRASNALPILRSAQATYHLQFNPLMLPFVHRGENHLRIGGQTTGTPRVAASVGWLEYSQPLAPSPPKLLFPPDGADMTDPDFVFRWEPGRDWQGGEIAHSFIEINERPDFTGLPIGEFRRYTPIAAGRLPTEFKPFAAELFRPGQTYFWRVRACAAGALHSDWSEVRSFTTRQPELVRGGRIEPGTGPGDLRIAWNPVDSATHYEIHGSNMHGFHASRNSLPGPMGGELAPTLVAVSREPEHTLMTNSAAGGELFAHYRIVAVNADGGRGEASEQIHLNTGQAYLLRQEPGIVAIRVVTSMGPFEFRPTPTSAYTPGFFVAENWNVLVQHPPEGAKGVEGRELTFTLEPASVGEFVLILTNQDGDVRRQRLPL